MQNIDSAFPEFQPEVLRAKRRLDRLLAPLCGLGALLFCLLAMPWSLPAGVPAELTATALGLPAQTPDFHLLWRALAAAASAWPFAGTTGQHLAVLGALCVAATAMLLYQITVELLMHRLIPNGSRLDGLKVRAIHAGGVTAAAAFVITVPTALAGTRAELRCLDALLPALTLLLFLRYLDGSRPLYLILSAIVCGLGMAESLGCLMLAMVLTVWGAVILWRQEKNGLPMVAFLGLAVSVMLLLCPFVAQVTGIPGNGAAGLLAMQWDDLQSDYAGRSGLFLIAMAVLPLVLSLSTLRQTINYCEEHESLLINLALATAALLVLANVLPTFRNYALTAPEPAVLPSFCAALTAGFAACSWWAVGFSPRGPGETIDAVDLHHVGTPTLIKGLGYGLAAVFTASLVSCAAWTAAHLRHRADDYAQHCAELMLRELGPRNWLFGHTPADTHLSILAHERRRPLHRVPLAYDPNWSGWQLQSLQRDIMRDRTFDGLDRDRLSDAARLGPDVFLHAWLTSDIQAPAKLAIDGPPRLWSAAGFTPVPGGFFFSGTTASNLPARDYAGQVEVLLRARAPVVRLRSVNTPLAAVLAGTDENLAATAAYAAARLREEGRAAEARAVADDWQPVSWPGSSAERRRLATPLAWLWESVLPPGRPEQRDILHAIRQPESLIAQQSPEEYDSVTHRAPALTGNARQPESLAETYALARESAAQARIDQTFSWLALLEKQRAPENLLLSLQAEAHLSVTSDVAEAAELLRRQVGAHPRDLWSWHLLAVACLQRNDPDSVERDVLPAMIRACGNPANDLVRLTRALVGAFRGGSQQRTSRDLFDAVAEANPDLSIAREWALRLDMQLADEHAIRRDAGALLDVQPHHPQANYALALLAARSMQLMDADRLFTLSLAGDPTPQALVGRARLAFQRRLYEDAMQLARKATVDYPAYAEAWLILADTLAKKGKDSEAEVIRAHAAELGAPAATPPASGSAPAP